MKPELALLGKKMRGWIEVEVDCDRLSRLRSRITADGRSFDSNSVKLNATDCGESMIDERSLSPGKMHRSHKAQMGRSGLQPRREELSPLVRRSLESCQLIREYEGSSPLCSTVHQGRN